MKYLRVIDTRTFLDKEGYTYIVLEDPPCQPEFSSTKFKDLVPELEICSDHAKSIADNQLYKHQLDTFKNLAEGKNVILLSGTGSGKTESWAIYVLAKRLRALAIYPTLALAEDQYERLRNYVACIGGYTVTRIDAAIVDEYNRRYGVRARVRFSEELSKTLILVTNPAFLLADIKRAIVHGSSWISEYIRNVDLIIIDEIDFYGSSKASLLLTIIEFIVKYMNRKRPQIVILGATIGNPEDLAKYLTEINGRDTVLIYGSPFKALNRWIIVLGKNIDYIYKAIKNAILKDPKLRQLKPFIESRELFLKYMHILISEVRQHGYDVPEPTIEPEKIIAYYAQTDEDGVTLVFTPSIRTAERLYARVRSILGEEQSNRIVVHHHLVPKSVRSEIEDKLRRGEVKVAITVRTLMQGIDIGLAVRVIHYGLPIDLRELRQREGRKGRRPYIPFTESIVIPIYPWDYELVSTGIDGFRRFLELELENVYINPDNEFVKMFKGLAKLFARMRLDRDELELLLKYKLVRKSASLFGSTYILSERGKRIWQYINFYEFGPPYGYPRYLEEQGRAIPLEPISRRDLVEKLQPYTFDLSNEALIYTIDREGLHEIKLSDITKVLASDPDLEQAIKEYHYIKRQWNEEPNLVKDVLEAKLQSHVVISLDIPTQGFGILKEIPLAVRWTVESRRRITIVRHGEIYSYSPRETIELPAKTNVYYEVPTYGYIVELWPGIPYGDAKLAISLIRLALRFSKYRIPFREIGFSVLESVVEPPVVMIWEPEPSGILNSIDWREIEPVIDALGKDRLDFVLLKALDEDAAQYLVQVYQGDWSKPREIAKEVLKAIARTISRTIISVKPLLPSKKVVSVYVVKLKHSSETIYALAAIGDNYSKSTLCISTFEGPCAEVIDALRDVLVHVFSSKDKAVLVHYDQEHTLAMIAQEDATAKLLLDKLKEETRLIDCAYELQRALGWKPSLSELIANISRKLDLRSSIPLTIAKELTRCTTEKSDCSICIKRYCEAIAKALFILCTGRLYIPYSK